MLSVLTVFLLFISTSVKASAYDNEALELLQDAEKKKLFYLEEAKNLHTQTNKHLQDILSSKKDEKRDPGCQACISPSMQEDSSDDHKDYFIFISFSLPKETLKSLYAEASKVGVPLVLRGLKNDSFKETADYLKTLGIHAQIDPTLFKKYQISSVPTFIVVNKENYHTISGNISLQYAKNKFLERDE